MKKQAKRNACGKVSEELWATMLDLAGWAGELEDIGVKRESAKMRRIAGEIENICYSLDRRFKKE